MPKSHLSFFSGFSVQLYTVTFTFTLIFCSFSQTFGQQPKYTGETRVYNTIRIQSARPKIDGSLDDACWREGMWGDQYRQNMPIEQGPPSQRTMIKILYDNENIFVAFKCYDTEPEKTDRQMARRDEFAGDIVGVNFDSYFDHRTGFEFNMTAAGSKIDLILTNDGFDANWNPVWDGKVGQFDSGWIVEMQIPFSQLRYSNQSIQTWGLHSWRWLSRNKEEDQWNLIPRDNAGVLFHFGELHGLENLPKISRIEFMPYSVAKIRTYEAEDGNPFSDGRDPSLEFGLDGKIGIGSNFTVDYTINPDFGQVEADPSELNLTAFETYYEEKRPFFIEGRNIFNFSFDDYQLLYSRRIGHTPTYDPDLDSTEYMKRPENTSILGALKLTGKTPGGLSVGILESLTSIEHARISSPEKDYTLVAEPMTNYFAGRIQKDINKGNTTIGGIITSTYRNIDKEYLDFMSKSALVGGIDFRHYFKSKTYYIDFKATGTQVSGSKKAITDLQKQSSRYYQRIDAPHLTLDTNATSLSGTGGSLEFHKCANGHWRYGIGAHWSTPGMEINDMGFQNTVDKFLQGQLVSYVENKPRGIFRTYTITLTELNYWNFGGEYLHSEAGLETFIGFENKWEFHAEIIRAGKTLNVDLLRGGPGVMTYGNTSQDYYLSTDYARKLSFGIGYEGDLSDDGITARHQYQWHINWKVSNSFEVTPEFSYTKSTIDHQFIENDDFEAQSRYLLGKLHRDTYEMTLRLSYAITPVFTIQYYGSPYVTMGKYNDLKTLADADTKNPSRVFRSFTNAELSRDVVNNQYTLDDGINPVIVFDNPDFNFRQLRSNFVARWEYRRGSVLYFVWTHNRTSDEDISYSYGDNLKQLFNKHAENVFLIKFNYWFSL